MRERLEAVEEGHLDVEEDHIGIELEDRRHGLRSVLRLSHRHDLRKVGKVFPRRVAEYRPAVAAHSLIVEHLPTLRPRGGRDEESKQEENRFHLSISV